MKVDTVFYRIKYKPIFESIVKGAQREFFVDIDKPNCAELLGMQTRDLSNRDCYNKVAKGNYKMPQVGKLVLCYGRKKLAEIPHIEVVCVSVSICEGNVKSGALPKRMYFKFELGEITEYQPFSESD